MLVERHLCVIFFVCALMNSSLMVNVYKCITCCLLAFVRYSGSANVASCWTTSPSNCVNQFEIYTVDPVHFRYDLIYAYQNELKYLLIVFRSIFSICKSLWNFDHGVLFLTTMLCLLFLFHFIGLQRRYPFT